MRRNLRRALFRPRRALTKGVEETLLAAVLDDLAEHFWAGCRGRSVEEPHCGVHAQGPGDDHALSPVACRLPENANANPAALIPAALTSAHAACHQPGGGHLSQRPHAFVRTFFIAGCAARIGGCSPFTSRSLGRACRQPLTAAVGWPWCGACLCLQSAQPRVARRASVQPRARRTCRQRRRPRAVTNAHAGW